MRSIPITAVVFYISVFLSLQWQRIGVSSLGIHRLLQTKYEITSQNIRLDFSGDGSTGVFSQDVQVEIESIATGILTNDLGSDITLIATTYAASTERLTLYAKVQVRHPSYLTPSIKSLLLVAFRDNASDFIDYLSSFEEYSNISGCDVSSFDSFENLTDVGLKPTLRPSEAVQITPQPVASGTKELTVPIQLGFVGATTDFSGSIQDSIISTLTTMLRNNLDKDIELVRVSPAERRKLQSSIRMPLVITVIHPKWMTSTYARSLVMLALNNSMSELFAEVSNDDEFSGISSISVDDSFDVEEVVTTVPTHAPTPSLNTISTPISSPTASLHMPSSNQTEQSQQFSQQEPILERKTDTFPVTLIFVGVSSDEHLSSDSKIFLQNSISAILNQHLDPDIDLVEISVVPYILTPTRRRFLGDWFGVNILITLRYTIDTGRATDVSEHAASVVSTNIDAIDMTVLRDTEGFNELKGIEVIAAGVNLTSDDAASHDTGSEVTGESFWDMIPLWAWIAMATGIGVAIIIAVALCFVCCKRDKENSVQHLWTQEYTPRTHSQPRRRPSIRRPTSHNHTRRLQGSHGHSKKRRPRARQELLALEPPPPSEGVLALPSPPKQNEKFLALPPPTNQNEKFLALPPPTKQHENFLALPCPPRQDIVPALPPPPAPIVRRPSAISALSVSIYATEETRIVPYSHPNVSDPEEVIHQNVAPSRSKKAPDPDGVCY
eukprot:CCRYP_010593-RA/>CCRYP_010593-RA protein AED:0.02 eAED:0.02 QI:138/1/1/1/0/0/2/337/722